MATAHQHTTENLSDYEDEDFGAGSIIDDLIDDDEPKSSLRTTDEASSKVDSGIVKLKPTIRKTDLPAFVRAIDRKPGIKTGGSTGSRNFMRLSSNASVASTKISKRSKVGGRIQSHPHLASQGRLGTSNSQKSASTLIPKPSIVADRVASARKKKLNELISQNVELATKNDDLLRENRLLKLLQKRHESSLQKYENATEELPMLINQHNEQRRVDKAQLRRVRDNERRLEGQVVAMTQELAKKDSLVSRMKAIVEDKDLRNADEIKKRLQKADRELEFLKIDVVQKDRKYELDKSSLERQLKAERIKSKQLHQEIAHYRSTNMEIQTRLKQKERALNDMNLRVRVEGASKRRSPEDGRNSRISISKVSPGTSTQAKRMARVMTSNSNDARVERLLNKPKTAGTIATSITNISPLPAHNTPQLGKPGTAATSKWGGSTPATALVQLTPRSVTAPTPKPPDSPATVVAAAAKYSGTSVNTMSTAISAGSSGRASRIDSRIEHLPPIGQHIGYQQIVAGEGETNPLTPTAESRKEGKEKKASATPVGTKTDDMLSPPLVIRTVSSNEATPSIKSTTTVTSPTLDDLLQDNPEISTGSTLKRTPPLKRASITDPPKSSHIFQTEIDNSILETPKGTPKLGSRQSTISLEAILSAPVKPNRGKVKSPEIVDDLISFTDAGGRRRSNSKKLNRKGSSDSGFSVKKAEKKEYQFTPQVNNLYQGLPAGGPLAKKNSSENFEDLFKPQFVKKKSSTTNVSSLTYNESAETIFGNGDHSSPGVAGTVVQKNMTPKSQPRQNSQSGTYPARAISPYEHDELEDIFY